MLGAFDTISLDNMQTNLHEAFLEVLYSTLLTQDGFAKRWMFTEEEVGAVATKMSLIARKKLEEYERKYGEL